MTPSSDAPNRAATGFEGEVAGLGLTDIIQVNATNGFSGLVRVQHDDDTGAIFFRDGDIVHAELGKKTGEEAFFEIISWQAGRFTVQTNVFTALRTIQKSCGHLLLEAHAVQDSSPAPARASVAAATRPRSSAARRSSSGSSPTSSAAPSRPASCAPPRSRAPGGTCSSSPRRPMSWPSPPAPTPTSARWTPPCARP